MLELKKEIKQLLEVEEVIRILRQKKENELRKQLLKGEFKTNQCKVDSKF